MYNVEELLFAKLELLELAKFYEDHQVNLSDKFFEEYSKAIDSLKNNPENYLNLSKDIRRKVIRKFHCCILYEIDDNTIRVVSVKDMRSGDFQHQVK